jgi:hypothetical protein
MLVACPAIAAVSFYLFREGMGRAGLGALMVALWLWVTGGYRVFYGRAVDTTPRGSTHRLLFAAKMAVLFFVLGVVSFAAVVMYSIGTRSHPLVGPPEPHNATAPATSARSDAPSRDGRIEIAVIGDYRPHDESADDERNPSWWRARLDDRWLALCEQDGITSLVPTAMRTAPSGADGDPNGLVVSAPGCPRATVLIRGLSRTPGDVPAATVTQKRAPSSRAEETTWELSLLGRAWRLHFEDAVGLPLMITRENRALELRNWRDAASRMAEPDAARNDWGFASSVEVLWGGDLNGDAELDLLLKQGDAEIGTTVELFLSTGKAATSAPVLVDTFDYSGC